MSDRYAEWAEKTIAAYRKNADAGVAPMLCAEQALKVHAAEAGMEGELEIQLWHLICTLAAYSDSQGFFRDQVFGPKQHGGPMLHKIACAVRDFSVANGIDYDGLYRDVCAHLDSEPPASPAI